MHGSRKFHQRGSKFDNVFFFFFFFFFLVSEGKEDPNTAINERDGFAGGPMMAKH